ncbi:uncharacterized protein LOC129615446 [Condylostylus longicornis]|uniref:uncharacterized protein LOC129615446 n=1 Tax=Condylostylus longicornis TaxID=2530218 RepID=UPI00244E57E2|nr:uncharacterized protein LOC129615446 [Condylostylus longicornis]
MSPDTVCLDNQIKSLTDEKKWQDIIEIGKQLSHDEKSRYIWVWPNQNCLHFIKNCLEEIQKLFRRIGSGLLEWLIEQSTGSRVYGIEINEKWWTSKYSPTKFIQLNYVDNVDINMEFLKKCANNTENFILFFCYFNCFKTFRKYLNSYNGKYLMIIGPDDTKHKNQKIFTEPGPFNLGLNSNENVWKLYKFFEIDNNGNFLAFYIKG